MKVQLDAELVMELRGQTVQKRTDWLSVAMTGDF